ncbi:MAG: hypothetical protein DBY36_04850 [Clostridiales bacterium]|nr:MAG: hypothetical protein DBY36_04850 [Clostridiales bacterium]
MRKFVCLICALMMTLSACGSVRDADLNEKINAKYAGAAAYSATVEARMDHGETVSDYRIAYEYSAAGGHLMTVIEPVVLAGLSVRVGAEKMEITYDGAVFAPASLDGTGVSPVKLLCDVFMTWKDGFAESVGTEKEDGAEYVVYTVVSVLTGEELTHRTYFAKDTLEPCRSESFSGGKCVMTLAFSDSELTGTED